MLLQNNDEYKRKSSTHKWLIMNRFRKATALVLLTLVLLSIGVLTSTFDEQAEKHSFLIEMLGDDESFVTLLSEAVKKAGVPPRIFLSLDMLETETSYIDRQLSGVVANAMHSIRGGLIGMSPETIEDEIEVLQMLSEIYLSPILEELNRRMGNR